nr:MAG TPA: hypothetical protein [Caudoviricetes sp.]
MLSSCKATPSIRDRGMFNWGRSKIQFYYVPNC